MHIAKKLLAFVLSLLILVSLSAPVFAVTGPSLVGVYCDGGNEIFMEFSEPVARAEGEIWRFVYPSIYFYKGNTLVNWRGGHRDVGAFAETIKADEDGYIWKWRFLNTGDGSLPYVGENSIDGIRAYYQQQLGGEITVQFCLEEMNSSGAADTEKDGRLRLYVGESGTLLADNVASTSDAINRQVTIMDEVTVKEVFSGGDEFFFIRFSAAVGISDAFSMIHPTIRVYTAQDKLVAQTDSYGVAGGGTIEVVTAPYSARGDLWRWTFYNDYTNSSKSFFNGVTSQFETYKPLANGATRLDDVLAYYDDLYGAGCYFQISFIEKGSAMADDDACGFASVLANPGGRSVKSDDLGTEEGIRRNVEMREAAYYISEQNGEDDYDGLSPLAPYRTLNKIKTHSFGAGTYNKVDAIRLEGGGRYSGYCNMTLIGTEEKPVVLSSYGTGIATIDDGNCQSFAFDNAAYKSGKETRTEPNIALWNSENFIIENLRFEGKIDLTSYGTKDFVPLNKGQGISLGMDKTDEPACNAVFRNLEFYGVYMGIEMSLYENADYKFNNIKVENCRFDYVLQKGVWFSGMDSLNGGPHDQYHHVEILNNRFEYFYGDPGNVFEPQAIGVYNATDITISGNYIHHLGGFGNYNKVGSNSVGGSTALGIGNCERFYILANEIHDTRSNSYCDASAIDIDQDAHYGEVAFNLTYDNEGPSIQLGSWSGLYTEYVAMHHNISYNDVRGTTYYGDAVVNNKKVGEAGVIRFFGNVQLCDAFNNTFYISEPSRGDAYCINFEDLTTSYQQGNHDLTFYNNIFHTFAFNPVLHGQQRVHSTRLKQSQNLGVYNNHYSTLCCFVDNYTLTSGENYTNITDIAEFRTKCLQESFNGKPTGLVGNPGVTGNFASFVKPYGTVEDIRTITAFDLLETSPCIDAGIPVDPFSRTYLEWYLPTDRPAVEAFPLHKEDFHGNESFTDIGACAYETEPEPPAILYGDCNDDGAIDLKDVTRLKKYLAKFNPNTNISSQEMNIAAADCNGDGAIDLKDVTRLKKYLAKFNPNTGESSEHLGPVVS